MEINAVKGTVANQDKIIVLIMLRSNSANPRANPTPIIDPTKVCVVEIGSPILEHIRTTVAAPKLAANPLDWVIAVNFSPTVFITRTPQIDKPNTMQVPPKPKIHKGVGTSI